MEKYDSRKIRPKKYHVVLLNGNYAWINTINEFADSMTKSVNNINMIMEKIVMAKEMKWRVRKVIDVFTTQSFG